VERIPLGAKALLSNSWLTILYVVSIVIVFVLISQIFYPPLIVLAFVRVSWLIVVVLGSICLGFYDSAREALDSAERERSSERH